MTSGCRPCGVSWLCSLHGFNRTRPVIWGEFRPHMKQPSSLNWWMDTPSSISSINSVFFFLWWYKPKHLLLFLPRKMWMCLSGIFSPMQKTSLSVNVDLIYPKPTTDYFTLLLLLVFLLWQHILSSLTGRGGGVTEKSRSGTNLSPNKYHTDHPDSE